MKLFVCTYTNRVKNYCDEVFFDNLAKIAGTNPVTVIDNTHDNGEYSARIKKLIPAAYVERCVCPKGEWQFLRNVMKSANRCRELFLQSDCDHMLIIESDVLPPTDLVEKLEGDVAFFENRKKITLTAKGPVKAKPEPWGIIGGLYHTHHHNFKLKGIQSVTGGWTALSGCTLYNRELMKLTAFRWDIKQTAAFPDAFMSHDSTNLGFSNWNDHNIWCRHLEKSPGDRGHCDPLF